MNNNIRKKKKNKVSRKTRVIRNLKNDTGATTMKELYNAYIKSIFWKEIKRKYKKYKCEICGDFENLELHHISYNRLFCERESDLITLCRTCHQKEHDYLEQKKRDVKTPLNRN